MFSTNENLVQTADAEAETWLHVSCADVQQAKPICKTRDLCRSAAMLDLNSGEMVSWARCGRHLKLALNERIANEGSKTPASAGVIIWGTHTEDKQAMETAWGTILPSMY